MKYGVDCYEHGEIVDESEAPIDNPAKCWRCEDEGRDAYCTQVVVILPCPVDEDACTDEHHHYGREEHVIPIDEWDGTMPEVPALEGSLPSGRRKPCGECPWRRRSLPGLLGPNTAEEWVALAHSEEPIACHTTIDPDACDSDGEARWTHPGIRQCAGAAIYRSNVFKSPRNPEVHRLPADPELVFVRGEFEAHHGGAVRLRKGFDGSVEVS